MAEGRRITWIGSVPAITGGIFNAFDAALTAEFGATRIGTVSIQTVGDVTVASALYTGVLAQAMVKRHPDATLTLYLNVLWDGVPNIAALKAMVQRVFGHAGVHIIEDVVVL